MIVVEKTVDAMNKVEKRWVFDDKYGRRVSMRPNWEVDPAKRKLATADNVWNTAMAAIAYPSKRKKYMESLDTCYENGKYTRHPKHPRDDFSRDQYIMLIVANFLFGDISKFPPKFRLSKRFFNSPNIYFWWKYLKTGSSIFKWLFELTLKTTILTYYLRWFVYENITKKLPIPEFYAFHLMCWQYFTYREKSKKNYNIKLFNLLFDYLIYCERKTKGSNDLLFSLLTGIKSEDAVINTPNVKGFIWQNLINWQDFKFNTGEHEYTNAYFIKLDKERSIAKDILDAEIFK